jgi:hypothetical protein
MKLKDAFDFILDKNKALSDFFLGMSTFVNTFLFLKNSVKTNRYI